MKTILLILIAIITISLIACGSKIESTTNKTNDTIQIIQVDSMIVDTISEPDPSHYMFP